MLGVYSGERDNGSCAILVKLEWTLGCIYAGIFFVLCMAGADMIQGMYGLSVPLRYPLFWMAAAVFPVMKTDSVYAEKIGGLPQDVSRRAWDAFIQRYYGGLDEEKKKNVEAVCDVLTDVKKLTTPLIIGDRQNGRDAVEGSAAVHFAYGITETGLPVSQGGIECERSEVHIECRTACAVKASQTTGCAADRRSVFGDL